MGGLLDPNFLYTTSHPPYCGATRYSPLYGVWRYHHRDQYSDATSYEHKANAAKL